MKPTIESKISYSQRVRRAQEAYGFISPKILDNARGSVQIFHSKMEQEAVDFLRHLGTQAVLYFIMDKKLGYSYNCYIRD